LTHVLRSKVSERLTDFQDEVRLLKNEINTQGSKSGNEHLLKIQSLAKRWAHLHTSPFVRFGDGSEVSEAIAAAASDSAMDLESQLEDYFYLRYLSGINAHLQLDEFEASLQEAEKSESVVPAIPFLSATNGYYADVASLYASSCKYSLRFL
jgi:hypothetical protein